MNILEWLGTLPKRHVISWLCWGVVAVFLIGFGLINGSGDSLRALFQSLPRWHQLISISWAALAVLLGGLGLIARQRQLRQKIEDQLEQLNAKVDLLLASRSEARDFAHELHLPTPSPAKKIGWTGVISDTMNSSIEEVDQERATEIFARETEPTALVNAAIVGDIVIKRIILDTGSTANRSGASHSAYVEVKNNTTSPLTVRVSKGQVFENAVRTEGIQNLVVSEDITLTCPANGVTDATIPAYCLNQALKPPQKHAGNITPLKVRFEFDSQQSVWQQIADLQN